MISANELIPSQAAQVTRSVKCIIFFLFKNLHHYGKNGEKVKVYFIEEGYASSAFTLFPKATRLAAR